MAKLIYAALMSLDGYIEDRTGRFDWAVPDEEVHSFVNKLEATTGTQLYGRRMYEMMTAWQTIDDKADVSAPEVEFGETWRALDKVVYSRTLAAVTTPRTTLEREFDPAAVRAMKHAAERDLTISGPGLAQHAFASGLVDEIHLFVYPVMVGGGKPGLPDGVHADLELVDQQRFRSGVVYLHHRLALKTPLERSTLTG